MSTNIVLIVIFASLIHAFWNLLVKKSSSPELLLCLSKITESVLFLGPFIYLFAQNPYTFVDLKWILGASVFVSLNYYFLAKSYKYLDMTIAYPITRCSTLFLPLIAYIFIGEKLNAYGYIAIGLVTIGVATIQLRSYSLTEIDSYFNALKTKGFLYALLTALTVAAYTVWDKVAISNMPSFQYFYSYTFLTSILLFTLNSRKFNVIEMVQLFRQETGAIFLVAISNTVGYLLILYALSHSDASIVGTLRQTSLVFGFILGYFWLSERVLVPRIVSLVLIIAGSTLVSFI